MSHTINKTLVFFLVFTVVSSVLAYQILLAAYDSVLEDPTEVYK